jgi:hypothetical protein
MQFGAMTAPDLARLPVVRCGAAKNYYEGEVDLHLQGLLLEGRSLQRYRGGTDKVRAEVLDPIAGVMVEAKASIGRFGGALRRLLLAIPDLTPQDARNAQCLTEQVTQRALSVKAGQPPLSVGDFDRQLRRLLSGQDWKLEEDSELYKALAPLREVWEKLRQRLVGAQPAWLEWLAKPHELARLVDEHGCLRLPLEDLRMQSWWQELIEDISLSD